MTTTNYNLNNLSDVLALINDTDFISFLSQQLALPEYKIPKNNVIEDWNSIQSATSFMGRPAYYTNFGMADRTYVLVQRSIELWQKKYPDDAKTFEYDSNKVPFTTRLYGQTGWTAAAFMSMFYAIGNLPLNVAGKKQVARMAIYAAAETLFLVKNIWLNAALEKINEDYKPFESLDKMKDGEPLFTEEAVAAKFNNNKIRDFLKSEANFVGTLVGAIGTVLVGAMAALGINRLNGLIQDEKDPFQRHLYEIQKIGLGLTLAGHSSSLAGNVTMLIADSPLFRANLSNLSSSGLVVGTEATAQTQAYAASLKFWGGAFGVLGSLAFVAAIASCFAVTAELLVKNGSKMSPAQKAAVACDLFIQSVALVAMIGATLAMAAGALAAGPANIIIMIVSTLVLVSPMQIYGGIQILKLSDQLDVFAQSYAKYGFSGYKYLASSYRAQGWVQLSGPIGLASGLIAPAVAPFGGLLGGGVLGMLGPLGLFWAFFGNLFQQLILEASANSKRLAIQKEYGSFAKYWQSSYDAEVNKLADSADFKGQMRDMAIDQASAGQQRMVNLLSMNPTMQQLNLAAILREGASLPPTAYYAYVNDLLSTNYNGAFVNAIVNAQSQTINLTSSAQRQYVSSYGPLVSPSATYSTRINTGKRQFSSTLSYNSTQWNFIDGDTATTVDLHGLSTNKADNSDLTPAHLAMGGGDDVILAGARHFIVDGGTGFNGVDYSSVFLSPDAGIDNQMTVTQAADGSFTVVKSGKGSMATEAIQNTTVNYGKRVEKIQYLTSSYQQVQFTGTDVLKNIQWIEGSSGNDKFFGGTQDNFFVASMGNDAYSGGGGSDWVDYSIINTYQSLHRSGVTVVLDPARVNQYLGFSSTTGVTSYSYNNGQVQSRAINALTGIENVRGTLRDDTLVGDALNNVLVGGGGNDQILGGAGDDQLCSGDFGNATLDGGTGFDLADYATLTKVNRVAVVYDDGTGSVTEVANPPRIEGRYVLLRKNSQMPDTGMEFTEVRVYSGGVNVAFMASVTTSSSAGGNGLVDGDLSQLGYASATSTSNRQARNGTEWVMIDLGANFTIESIELDGSTQSASTWDSTDVGVFVSQNNLSADGSNYANLKARADVVSANVPAVMINGAKRLSANDQLTLTTANFTGLGFNTAPRKDTLISIENLRLGSGDDQITGNYKNNLLDGGDGNDTIFGGAGKDDILTGKGLDSVNAGTGDDRIFVTHANAIWGTNSYLTGASATRLSYAGCVSDISFSDAATSITLNGASISGDAAPKLPGGGVAAQIVLVDTPVAGQVVFWAQYWDGTYSKAVQVQLNNATGGGVSAMVLKARYVTGDVTSSNVAPNFNWNTSATTQQDMATNDTMKGYGVKAMALSAPSVWTDAKQMDGGDGVDTADYSNMGAMTYGIDVNLSNTNAQTVKARSDVNGSATVNSVTDSLQHIENVLATDGNDRIMGSDADNRLAGNAGDDWIQGGAGNDVISTGVGKDSIYGGAGDDAITVQHDRAKATWRTNGYLSAASTTLSSTGRVADINWSDTATHITLNGGSISGDMTATIVLLDSSVAGQVSFWAQYWDGTYTKAVKVQVSDVGTSGVSVQALGGTYVNGNVTLSNFNWNSQSFTAAATSDTAPGYGVKAMTLAVWTGVFTDSKLIDGGTGSDTADYSSMGVNAVGIGIDADLSNTSAQTVKTWRRPDGTLDTSSVTDTLTNIENLLATNGNDRIIGSDAGNRLSAYAGDDSIRGGAGADVIYTGEGKDTVNAGAGNDAIVVQHARSHKIWSASSDTGTISNVILSTTGTLGDIDFSDVATSITLTGTWFGGDVAAKIVNVDTSFAGQVSFYAQYFDGTLTKAVKAVLSTPYGSTGSVLFRVVSASAVNGDVTQATDFNWNQVFPYEQANNSSPNQNTFGVKVLTLAAGVGGYTDAKQIDGGLGNDTVDYTSLAANGTGIEADLSNIGAQTVKTWRRADGTLDTGSVTDSLQNIENLRATDSNDKITGSNAGNQIFAYAGDDSILGGSGADVIDTGVGKDTVNAGAGDDRIVVEHARSLGTWRTSAYLSTTATVLTNSGRVADINFNDPSNTIQLNTGVNGGSISARMVLLDTSVAGQASFWVQDWGSGKTMAVKVQLSDLSTGGVSAQVVKAAYVPSDAPVFNVDWNKESTTPVTPTTNDWGLGSGVKSMTLSAWVGVYTDAKQVDGGTGNDTVDYSNMAVNGTGIEADLSNTGGQTVKTGRRNDGTLNTNSATDSLSNIENLVATVGNDKLIGSDAANRLAGNGGDDSIQGGAGDDVIYTGVGQDSVDAGVGNDVISVEHTQATWNVSGYLSTAPTPLISTGRVGDIDFGDALTCITLRGGGFGADQAAQTVGIDFSVAEQVSWWAQYWNGVNTVAVKLQLNNTSSGGVSAQVVKAASVLRDVTALNFDWDSEATNAIAVATSDAATGVGVKAMSLSRLGVWTDAKQIDGGAGSDTLDYSRMRVGSNYAGTNSTTTWSTGGYLSSTGGNTPLSSTGHVADINLSDASNSFTLRDGTTGQNFTGKITKIDSSVAGKLSFWVEGWYGGPYTEAVKVELKDAPGGGVTGNAVWSCRATGNVSGTNFDWDGPLKTNMPTVSSDSVANGYGVKAMTLAIGAGTSTSSLINGIGIEADLSNLSAQTIKTRRASDSAAISASVVDTVQNVENMLASYGNDKIIGSDAGNQIWGYAGDDSIQSAAGDDVIYTGTGKDSVDAGAGNDAITVEHSQATWSTPGYLVTTSTTLVSTGRVGDVDLTDALTTITLNGGLVGADQVAQMVRTDTTMAGQVSFWAQYWDGTNTDAVKVQLNNTSSGGVSAQVVKAASVLGNVTAQNFDWDNAATPSTAVATSDTASGVGVKAMTLSRLGVWTDAKQIDGGAGSDTLDYSRMRVGSDATNSIGIEADLSNLSAQTVKTRRASDNTTISASMVDNAKNIENLIATDGNDKIMGSDDANRIAGGAGDDSIQSGAGDDVIFTGTGKDSVNGGAGNDAIGVEHSQATWRVSSYLGTTSTNIVSTGRVGDIDLTDARTSITLNGGLVGGDQMAQMVRMDTTVAGQVSFWAQYWDGTNTDAVKVQLNNTSAGGVSAQVVKAASVLGNVTALNFDWNNAASTSTPIATSDTASGLGVKAMTLSRLGVWTDAKQIDGGADSDTLDYTRIRVGSDATNSIGIEADLSNVTAQTVKTRLASGNTVIGDSVVDKAMNIENLLATDGDDKIMGSDANNRLAAYGGDDNIQAGAGDDEIYTGTGRDTVDAGAGNDIMSIDHSRSQGVANVSGYLGMGGTTLTGLSRVADINWSDAATRITLNGGAVGGDVAAKIVALDNSVAGQVSFWAQYWDGAYTKAVKVQLSDVGTRGVSAKVLNTAFVGGDMTSMDCNWNQQNHSAPLATSDTAQGFGVKAMTLSTWVGAYTDSKQMDGGADSDTVDYSNLAVSGVGIEVNLSNVLAQTVKTWRRPDGTVDASSATDSLMNIENVLATNGNDKIIGSDAVNKINGDAGDDSIQSGAGDDVIYTGTGNDSVDAGTGDDAITVEHSQATWSTPGYLGVNSTSMVSTGRVGDIDLTDALTRITLNGSTIGSDQVAQMVRTDTSVTGQVSFWAQYWDGTNTQAVKVQLNNTSSGGVSAQVVKAASVLSDVTALNFDWNNAATTSTPIATSDTASGVGVKAMTLARLGVWTDAKQIDGGAGSDTLDYSHTKVGTSTSVSTAPTVTWSTNGYLSSTGGNTPLSSTGHVADIHLSDDSNAFTLRDGATGQNFAGKVTKIDSSVAGKLSFWVEGWYGGPYTEAVKVELKDLPGAGVTGNAVWSCRANGNVTGTNFDWDGPLKTNMATLSSDLTTNGYGVKAMTLATSAGTATFINGIGIEADLSNLSAQTVKTRRASDNTAISGSVVDNVKNIENLLATDGHDMITGSDADNQIYGFAGNDLINGGAGNDTLSTGTGLDTVNGGAGDDKIMVAHAPSAVSGRYVLLRHLPGSRLALALSELEVWSQGVNVARNIGVTVYESTDGHWSSAAGAKLVDGSWVAGADYRSGQSDGSSWVMVDLGQSYAISSVGMKSLTGSDSPLGADVALFVGDNDLRADAANANALKARSDVHYLDLPGQAVNGVRVLGQDGGVSVMATQLIGGRFTDAKTIDGGDGEDLVSYQTTDSSSNSNAQQLFGVGIDGSLVTGRVNTWYEKGVTKAGSVTDILSNVEDLGGTDAADSLIGNDAANKLAGFGGDDYIDGGAGNDTLFTGAGRDTVKGGEGDDVIFTDQETAALSGRYILLRHQPGVARQLALSEIKVWSGGVNVALNATVQESQDGHVGAMSGGKLVRGLDANTTDAMAGYRSSAADGNSWVMVDLGQTYTIDRMEVTGLMQSPSTQAPWGSDIGLFVSDTNLASDAPDYVRLAARNDTRYAELNGQTINGLSNQLTADGRLSFGVERFIGAKSIDGGAGNDWVVYRGSQGAKGVGIQGNLATGQVATWFENGAVKAGSAVDAVTNVENLGGTDVADSLIGNSGANKLVGYDGNDTLEGGAGNDQLAGGTGSDTYKFAAGWGTDVIFEEEATGGSTDVDRALFAADVGYQNLWFSKQGTSLVINRIGSSDSVTVNKWYEDPTARVERFEVGNRAIVGTANVEAFVAALSTFGAPPTSIGAFNTTTQSAIYSRMAQYWS